MASHRGALMAPVTPFLLRLTRPRSTFPCHLDVLMTTIRSKDFFGHGTRWRIVNACGNRSAFSGVRVQRCSSAQIRRGVQIGYRDDETRCGAFLAALKGSWALH